MFLSKKNTILQNNKHNKIYSKPRLCNALNDNVTYYWYCLVIIFGKYCYLPGHNLTFVYTCVV